MLGMAEKLLVCFAGGISDWTHQIGENEGDAGSYQSSSISEAAKLDALKNIFERLGINKAKVDSMIFFLDEPGSQVVVVKAELFVEIFNNKERVAKLKSELLRVQQEDGVLWSNGNGYQAQLDALNSSITAVDKMLQQEGQSLSSESKNDKSVKREPENNIIAPGGPGHSPPAVNSENGIASRDNHSSASSLKDPESKQDVGDLPNALSSSGQRHINAVNGVGSVPIQTPFWAPKGSAKGVVGELKGKDAKQNNGSNINSTEFDYLVKTIVYGQSGVGKRSLVHKFCQVDMGQYVNGVDFKIRSMDIYDKTIKHQIWWSSSDDRFCNPTDQLSFRGTHVVILAIDLTDRETWALARHHLNEIRRQFDGPVILVGTKADLSNKIIVRDAEVQEFCQREGIAEYIKTSAKDGTNVELVFKKVSEEFLRIKGKLAVKVAQSQPQAGANQNGEEPKKCVIQ